MTRLLVLVAALALHGFALAPEAREQSKADEEAITRVLLAETDRFFARDFEGWASTFVQVPGATQAWNNADGTYVHRLGWETIGARIREFMKNNPTPDRTPLHRENFMFRHYGNAAFVTFDKYMGDRKTAKPVREIRVVERVGSDWKIVCVAAFIDHLKPAATD
jgi:hypothetical protein